MSSIPLRDEGISPSTTAHFMVRCNRAQDLFQAAARSVGANFAPHAPPVCFTHWETYGGAKLETDDLPADTRIIRLLDRAFANRLSHKGKLARLMQERGLAHLAPATYTTVEDALAHSGAPVSVWFFKHVVGTAGKNMYCVATEDLAGQKLPAHTIIQAEIGDIELIDGCKFTSRIYVLLWNKRAWLYRDGFMLKHGIPYRAGSTDYAVQIDHRGYHLANSQIRMELMTRDPQYEARFDMLRRFATALMPVIDECCRETDKDTYLLLGIDTLFQTSGRIQLVEINTSPNFVHTAEVNAGLNIPFFESVMRTVLGFEEPRFFEIV